MAVYIVVGLVVLAGLVFAYRSFGRAAATRIDPATLLATVLDAADGAAAELDEIADAAPLAGARTSGSTTSAKTLRRRITGLAQQLETLDIPALDERSAGAQALVAVALDELAWAAGLCTADIYATTDGMRDAVGALRAHANRCLHDATLQLAASVVAEEVERAP